MESYDINLENCKTFIDSESNSSYDDENLTLFCTKGQTASDGYSIEMLIDENYYTAEELETEQVIENVVTKKIWEITDYKCYEGNTYGYETITDVVIPSKINGITALYVRLSEGDDYGLTSLYVPSSITHIYSYGFCSISEDIIIYEDDNFKPLLHPKAFQCPV